MLGRMVDAFLDLVKDLSVKGVILRLNDVATGFGHRKMLTGDHRRKSLADHSALWALTGKRRRASNQHASVVP